MLYVEAHGPEGGVPILFLHGSLVAGWMWTSQVEELAEYRCIVPDLPGMGMSGDVPWQSLADTSDRLAEIIRAQCAAGKAHLVGLSLGGVVALHLLSRHPELIESVIVSGVPHGKVPLGLRLLSRVMLSLYCRPWGAGVIARMLGIPHDDSLQAFTETAAQADPASLKRMMREVYQTPLPRVAAGAQVPLLAVAGERDSGPARAGVDHLRTTIPGSTGCLVPGVGHPWNAEAPQLFSEMVRQWVASRTVGDGLVCS